MRLFRGESRPRFPADMLRWLELFGRYSFDPIHSGVDASVNDRLGSLYEYATGDREGFLTELRSIVAADQGGFATYGAARLVWEMFSADVLRIPAALPLVDAGIRFKLARGLPTALLTGYEMDRLFEIRREGGQLG